MMGPAASASPLAAAACASVRLIVPFAAKAKVGSKATDRIHSTKRMTASPFFAVLFDGGNKSSGTQVQKADARFGPITDIMTASRGSQLRQDVHEKRDENQLQSTR